MWAAATSLLPAGYYILPSSISLSAPVTVLQWKETMADLANEQPTLCGKKTKKLVKVGNKNLLQCLQASLISVMIGRFIFFWLLCGIKKNTHRRCQNRSSSEPSTSLITHWMCGCVIRIIKSGFNTMHGSDRPGIININVDSYYY